MPPTSSRRRFVPEYPSIQGVSERRGVCAVSSCLRPRHSAVAAGVIHRRLNRIHRVEGVRGTRTGKSNAKFIERGLCRHRKHPTRRTATRRVDQWAGVVAKLEWANPTGSMKDRMAGTAIEGAIRDGHLRPGDTVVENTAGTTGISLAFVCAALGYGLHIVFSDAFSVEKLLGPLRVVRLFLERVATWVLAGTCLYLTIIYLAAKGGVGPVWGSNPGGAGSPWRSISSSPCRSRGCR